MHVFYAVLQASDTLAEAPWFFPKEKDRATLRGAVRNRKRSRG